MSPKSASRDKQAIRRLTYKIIALILIPIIVFITISYIESLSDRQIADLLEIFNFSKFGTPLNGALAAFLLLLFGLFAFLPLIRLIQKFFSALTGKYFVISLAALAVLGAVSALYIPSYTSLFKTDTQQSTSSTQNGQGSGNQQNQSSKDSSSDLRLHLLYITGGIIAVLGLIETNRKNSQDHIRQVHAARRDRYIEAVDKLSSEQAPVRLGGVYALVGLVDEWLDDDNIDEETRIKEGQIIINNLCSYIRSPFPLAEKIEEYEAHEKLENLKRKEPKSLSPLGFLRLDFLNKYFIGSNDDKKIEQITADYSKFHEEQDVRRTIFVEMSKRSSTFAEDKKGQMVKTASGTWSEFDFDFSRAPIFYPLNNLKIEKANFSYSMFYAKSNFDKTIFVEDAKFNGVTFTQIARFFKAIFTHDADFRGANFSGANFSKATFTQNANFNEATFTHEAYFWESTFTHDAYFWGSIFTHESGFLATTFAQKVNFSYAFFEKLAPTFASGNWRARFSVHTAQEDYKFSVRSGSKPIPPGVAELDGIKRQIPVGTVLFDPDSGRISDSAKPIEESDIQGETPSK